MKKDVTWFLDLYRNEQLDLDPSYQRRSVWSLKDRKFFLDTIFKNYPCPAVFLHKEINEDAGKLIYHVVDVNNGWKPLSVSQRMISRWTRTLEMQN